jgi:RNA polymerase sigma-70 factor, ECF subfamily
VAVSGFAEVVLPHLDAAVRLARWIMRDPVAAEDVVQDACVRALQYFPTFRGGDGRAWLLQIVRNTAYGRLARRGRSAETEMDEASLEVADPAPDPEAMMQQGEAIGQLEGALAALPLELRECLVLREFEEMSYRDIARVTGVPVGTVMSRLWRARQSLIKLQAGAAS